MATHIYWFSGTGNSLHVARRIAEGLGDAELLPIARAVYEDFRPAERIGIVFPVYAWGPPELVARFLREKFEAPKDAYVFLAMTCGGSAGSAGKIAANLLGQRGVQPAAVYSLRMVENYPPMGGPPKPQKQDAHLAAAEGEIARIVESVRAGTRGHADKQNWLLNLIGPAIYPMFIHRVGEADAKFSVDDKCNQCGLCERICPVADIELVDGRPRWLGHCQQCYACYHFCPQQAIQRGRKTENQPRYHHPEVKAADLCVRRDVAQG